MNLTLQKFEYDTVETSFENDVIIVDVTWVHQSITVFSAEMTL